MKRLVITLVSVFFVLATILTVSYAWFINSDFEEPEISGYSYAAYFASGNGTEEKPYTITNKRHLYNLAWLQFLGNWNEVDKTDGKTLTNQYHFQISPTIKEIDMTGYPLPPIGTETYPFVGVFKGNGCVIKNLEVTNNLTDFGSNHPKSSAVNDTTIGDLNIIGMFGIVGNYKTMYNVSSYVPSVQNFYLDNVTISSKATETLIGLLAGYVAESGNITNVGIYRSGFNFSSAVNHLTGNDFVSKFSLIGDYDSENIGWEDKPTSGGGSGEEGYKGWDASIDMDNLFNRVEMIYNTSTTGSGTRKLDSNTLNNITGFEGTPQPFDGTYGIFQPKGKHVNMPIKVTNELTEEWYSNTSNSYETVDDTNPGYITGQNSGGGKIDYFKVAIATALTANASNSNSSSDYTGTGITTDPTTGAITDVKIWTKRNSDSSHSACELADDVYGKGKELASGRYELVKSKVIKLLEKNIITGIIFDGQKPDQNNWITIENANVFGDTKSITLPPRSISFTAPSDGYVCLVGVGYGGDSSKYRAVTISQYGQDEWGNKTITYLNDVYATKPDKNGDFSTSTSKVDSTYTYYYGQWAELPQGKLYYYEIPVEAGNYVIHQAFGGTGGLNIIYLDLGQNGSENNGGSVETPTYSGNLSSIDFVYTTSGSLETVLEDKSNVLLTVKVATVTTTAIYFKRKVEDELDQVLYCITSTGYTITNIGSGTATSVTEADWSSQ